MASVKDIISSIFRKYANEELSPEFIRDESNEVCDILEIPRIGDPGRTAREFAEKGYVSKYNGTCKYAPNAIRLTLKDEFESYVYVYDLADFENKAQKHSQRKLNDLLVQIKKIIENDPDKRLHIENELNLKNSLQTSSLIYPLIDEVEFVAGLNDEQILDKLAKCLAEDHDKYKVKGYPVFGFKYGHIIAKHGLSINKIVKRACSLSNDIKESLHSLIRHGVATFEFASREGCLGDATVSNINTDTVDYQMVESDAESMGKLSIPPFSPSQVIYYGVPGCGKSKTVNEEVDGKLVERGITDKEFHKMRVVFHKEYSNADFLGQILPCVKEKNVDYHFTPGPFAQIIRRAYRNPTEPFFLIVEEINRGDAPAIFGEMFQLLDRVKPNEIDDSAENVFAPGWSSYGITNHDLNAYIRLKSEVEEPCYENVLMIPRDDCNSKINKDGQLEINEKMLYFGGNSSVRLPPNLSILATMNTSDQNVFTLDNAFQRRFAMKMIPNVLDESSAQYNMLIDGTGVCWGKFREWINKKVNEAPFAISTEDKCLGGWFICGEKESEDKCKPFDKVEFAEKVLKYLWDDAFKRRRPDIFESNVKSLSDLISRFCEGDCFDSFTAVFKMNDADVAALKVVSLDSTAAAEPRTELA